MPSRPGKFSILKIDRCQLAPYFDALRLKISYVIATDARSAARNCQLNQLSHHSTSTLRIIFPRDWCAQLGSVKQAVNNSWVQKLLLQNANEFSYQNRCHSVPRAVSVSNRKLIKIAMRVSQLHLFTLLTERIVETRSNRNNRNVNRNLPYDKLLRKR